MATMSIEDMRAIVALIRETQAAEVKTPVAEEKLGGFKKEALKYIKEYHGEREKYSDWALKTVMAVDSLDSKIAEVMQALDKKVEEMDGTFMLDLVTRVFTKEKGYHVERWAKELFDILGVKLQGPAFSIHKLVKNGNGFEVWRMLRMEAKPNTPISALKAVMEVVETKRIVNLKDIMPEMTEWEVKVQTCLTGHGEKISDLIQIAVATSKCPLNIQDVISQNAEKFQKYQDFKTRLRSMVENKIAIMEQGEKSQMDIGKVEKDDEGWPGDGDWGYEQEEYGHQGYDLNYIDMGKGKGKGKGKGSTCFICHETGHYARECPQKGKGKGKGVEKGGGKGWNQKGFTKGWPKGGGKGNYFPYACNYCGIIGHKEQDCRKKAKEANEIEYETEGKEHTEKVIGGVGWAPWTICAVSCREHKEENVVEKRLPEKTKAKFEKMPRKQSQKEKKNNNRKSNIELNCIECDGKMKTKNSFEALRQEEKEEQTRKEVERSDRFFGALHENAEWSEKQPKKTQTELRERNERYFKELNVIENKKRKKKITIDSGAEESVWPVNEVNPKELVETEASKNGLGFIAANGSHMDNYGAVKVKFENGNKPMSMNFHATTVKKPLAAVSRITDQGNKVSFGLKAEDNFILNIESGEKIFLKRERGTYVLEIEIDDKASVFPRQE